MEFLRAHCTICHIIIMHDDELVIVYSNPKMFYILIWMVVLATFFGIIHGIFLGDPLLAVK
jgi:hypothetical protein